LHKLVDCHNLYIFLDFSSFFVHLSFVKPLQEWSDLDQKGLEMLFLPLPTHKFGYVLASLSVSVIAEFGILTTSEYDVLSDYVLRMPNSAMTETERLART
jgi:hypothetical protein